MRSASEPKTTRLAAKKAQFSTAISSAVFLPKGASAFGNGNGCELPAARIIGMIFSGLRIQGLRQNKRTRRQTPAPSVALCAGFSFSATFVSPCHHAASAIKCALRSTPSFAPRTSHSERLTDQLCTHIPFRTIARNRLRRPPNSCSNWARSLACWPAGKASSP